MGALTTNRKRGEECFSLNRPHPSPVSIFCTSNKKPRLFPPHTSSPQSKSPSRITTSIIYRYPAAAPPFHRKVHAPCGGRITSSSRLVVPSSSGREITPMRNPPDISIFNGLVTNYRRVKTLALGALRYPMNVKEDEQKVKKIEVIDVADEEDNIIQSGFQEGEGEDISVISEQMFREGNGGIIESDNGIIDVEMTDKRPEQPSSSSVVTEQQGNGALDLGGLALGLEEMSEPLYQKLLHYTDTRSPKLKDLEFQIELKKRELYTLQLQRSVTKKKEEEVQVVDLEPLVLLTDEEERAVSHAFSAKSNAVLVFHENSNISITGRIMQCLTPGAWLNDEVINLYLDLLKERELREPKRFLKCHFFNTFFYKKLIGAGKGYDFRSVRRWTTDKKLGYNLIDCDKIFVPVHKEIHWCLAIINKKDKKFQYLDSLGGLDKRVFKILASYIRDEVNDKMGKEMDASGWVDEHVNDIPLQENGSDCGMFMIKYIDYCSQDRGLCFKQEDMPYFRRKTALEILRKRCE